MQQARAAAQGEVGRLRAGTAIAGDGWHGGNLAAESPPDKNPAAKGQ